MISIHETNRAAFDVAAKQLGLTLPIEQTAEWVQYQAGIDGRSPWREDEGGCFLIQRDGETIAFITFIDFETHKYHYLRSAHGPVWVHQPTRQEESEVIDALSDFVKKADKHIVFLRMCLWNDLEQSTKTLSIVPYDQTVVIDVTGGDDAILTRMKSRGRRDVRKALRECLAICGDETNKAIRSFADYYNVMVETGNRDGFTPAPLSDYEDMIRALAPDHVRVFAARVDGVVSAWSIVTINDDHAVRYYAAMRSNAMRMHITDKLLYAECCELGRHGITAYDLMGIGDDFAPSLKGLNEFKTKFTPEITHVAPDRDVPLHKVFYTTLAAAKKLKK